MLHTFFHLIIHQVFTACPVSAKHSSEQKEESEQDGPNSLLSCLYSTWGTQIIILRIIKSNNDSDFKVLK